jgi:hypothetical protein
MDEIPNSPEDLIARWKFEDNFREVAVELITAGAHLGGLALARNILATQILKGNVPLKPEELTKLVAAVKDEIREQARKGIANAGGFGTD